MTNLFAAQTGEVCYVTVEDVRDSLGGVFAADATPLIEDAEIEKLIVQAQKQVNVYLNAINPNISCDGVDCPCDEVPLDIKRATLQLIDNIYTQENKPTVAGVGTLKPGDIVREKTACGVEVEYYTGTSEGVSDVDCLLVDCKTRTLLDCYEVCTSNIGFNCSRCPCGFYSSFHCYNKTCGDKKKSCGDCNSDCNC